MSTKAHIESLAVEDGYQVNPVTIPVKCPYCEHVNDYENEMWGDEFEIELDCDECGRWLTTTLDAFVIVKANEVEKEEEEDDESG